MKLLIKRSLPWIIIVTILFSAFENSVLSHEGYTTADIENLVFKQELAIPIDTSLDEAKHQPIDIRIEFDSPCWAEDETSHSVRVAYDDGSGLTEIDSQIYDLEYCNDAQISSGSLVFLIPEEADGKEKYYVLYDSSETSQPEYEDHIVLDDTHYFYEPISGQKIDIDYYGIKEDGYVIFAVVQKGELLGNPISQSVMKFKPGSTVVETYNLDQLGVFDMRYGTVEEPGYIGSAWATKVAKDVLVDGNLMVRLRVECVSPRGDIKTDNIYTYYYCPGETKSISINVDHEVVKKIDIDEPSVLDGTYAGIISIKSMSATIEKMNVGYILPSVSLYGEDDVIKEFSVPPNPDSIEKELILSTQDDCDLGKKAWVCLNNPSTGKAHGLILHSSEGLIEGEEDGVQIKSYVKQNIKLPGLEADTGNVFLTRNAYEKGSEHNTILDEGFSINFDVEFTTIEDGGYEKIDSESEIYQTLVKNNPIYRENVSRGEVDEVKRFSLTTFVHLAPSFPMGSLLSAALGKNIPYIYIELYEDNSFKSSGSAGRLPLGPIDLDLDGKNLFQKVKTVLGIFDWKNSSFFKKIVFPDLEQGTYLVKIYKENPFFAKERQYIGFDIVEVEKDASTHIYCRPQGTTTMSIIDQDGKGVQNVQFHLLKDDIVIADACSDENGSAVLAAPCYPIHPYKLNVMYQGFLAEEKNVKLGLMRRFFSLEESFEILLYNLELNIKDTWGMKPYVDVSPVLTSEEMVDPITIFSEKQDGDKYVFTNLYPASYVLKMSYKSVSIEKSVSVSEDKKLNLEFPAEFALHLGVLNSYGMQLENADVSLKREGKTAKTELDENGIALFSIPPGEYEIKVSHDGKELAKQNIIIRGDKSLDIVTSKESALHMAITYLGIVLLIFSILFMIWKKKLYAGFKLLAIALIITAIVLPWWSLNGDNGTVSTTTNTFLFPSNIVTLTQSSSAIGGEVAAAPELLTTILDVLSILLVVLCILILASILLNKLKKTSTAFSILSIVLVLVTVLLFFVTISQVTEVGVGSFSGSSDLDISIPGLQESTVITCNWGPGPGFYLGIITGICLVIGFFVKRYECRYEKK